MTERRLTLLTAVAGGLILLAVALAAAKTDFNMTGVETSRMAAVQAIVDRGETAIDNSCFRTVDKGAVNGRWYSDKPPLLTFAEAGLYALLRLGGLGFERHYSLTIYLFNLINAVVFGGAIVGLAGLLMRRRGFPPAIALAAGFAALFSTLAWSYSITIGNHVPAAAAILLLALLLERREPTARRAAAAGAWVGVIFNLELVLGTAFFPALFLWLRRRNGAWRAALAAVLAFLLAGPGLAALLNFINHGSPLSLYFGTHHPDLAGKDYLFYAFNALFGFEGVFLYTPALLFLAAALPLPINGERQPEPARNALLAGAGAALLLYLIGTSDYGGWCYGFRFLVPLEPLVLLYAADAVLRRRSRPLAAAFALALLWGIVTAAVGLYDPWCAGYEGSSTTAASVHQHVRNSFCANLFAWSFECDPESALSRFFYHRFYGPETARRYLFETYQNSKNINMMRTMLRRIEQEESPL